MNLNNLSDIFVDENQFQREKLQYLFDKSLYEYDKSQLRKLYSLLRQLELCEYGYCENEVVELTSLAEGITVACDILASDSEISFIFCSDEPCYVMGNRKLISKALLNLLSNAYLHGKGRLITVKTICVGDTSRLEVTNAGGFINTDSRGKGLDFVRNACQQMWGSLLIEQGHYRTRAVMTFRNIEKMSVAPDEEYNPFGLISDRLSPVYVEMFGMKYH